MAEVALVWYTMSDTAVEATKGQVRRWAEELELQGGTFSRSSALLAFRKACGSTLVTYERDGTSLILSAVDAGKTAEFETYQVMATPANGGPSIRMAEVKLFMARRTRRGVVQHSHRVKTMIRPSLSDEDKRCAERWIAAFTEMFEASSGEAPAMAIRHIVRLSLLEAGIPVGRHKLGIYFFYTRDLHVVRRVQDFVTRAVPSAQLIVLPVEPGTEQYGVFARAADLHLVAKIEQVMDRIDGWLAMAIRRDARAMITGWRRDLEASEAAIAEHERILGHQLSDARATLATAHEVVEALVEPGVGNLRSVTSR